MPVNTFAFDAYGTLFDVHSAILRHAENFGADAAAISELWRTKQLEYTWTLAHMGHYEDFWSLTEQALDFALSAYQVYDARLRETLLFAYAELEAFPDVAATLKALREAGHNVLIATNATRDMIDRALIANQMRTAIDDVVSVDDINIYKPKPDIYHHLTECAKARPDEIVLISSNRWDVAGARAAGLNAVWCNRAGRPDEYPRFTPTKTVTSLEEIPSLAL